VLKNLIRRRTWPHGGGGSGPMHCTFCRGGIFAIGRRGFCEGRVVTLEGVCKVATWGFSSTRGPGENRFQFPSGVPGLCLRYPGHLRYLHITGCALAQHCYNGDVRFLWGKLELCPPVKFKPLNRLAQNLSQLITSTRGTFVPSLVKIRSRGTSG